MTLRPPWPLVLTFAAMAASAAASDTSREAVLRYLEGPSRLKLAVHHVEPTIQPTDARPPVLLIHGATFPTALASAYRMDGHSWMDDLAARGFDVWALDFAGYGESERYPEMSAPADSAPPLLRTSDGADQIASTVDAILGWSHAEKVSLVAHSWGTLPAGLFAATAPDRVDRLVLFGPVARRSGSRGSDAPKRAAHRLVSLADQWRSFQSGLPAGVSSRIDRSVFETWGASYLQTDPASGLRNPPSVKVPVGPSADVGEAWSGSFPYSPEGIRAPVLIVRGEWDIVTTDEDLDWLCRQLSGAAQVSISTLEGGTHRMHLEGRRQDLFDEVGKFLEAAPSPNLEACPRKP